MHKIQYNKMLPDVFVQYSVIDGTVHSCSTIEEYCLHITSVERSIGHKSVQYVGSVLRNELPQDAKKSVSNNSFKNKAKYHLCYWNSNLSCVL